MRVSYEGNKAIVMVEGLSRPSYYFTEPNIYDGTENTISTIISKDLTKKGGKMPVKDLQAIVEHLEEEINAGFMRVPAKLQPRYLQQVRKERRYYQTLLNIALENEDKPYEKEEFEY